MKGPDVKIRFILSITKVIEGIIGVCTLGFVYPSFLCDVVVIYNMGWRRWLKYRRITKP